MTFRIFTKQFTNSRKLKGSSEQVAEQPSWRLTQGLVAKLRPEGPTFNSHARKGGDQELSQTNERRRRGTME